MTAHDTAARLFDAAPAADGGVRAIDTSVGPIKLSSSEQAMLSALGAQATLTDGQRFYQSVSAHSAFPPEWELLVLRATLNELPERDDLLQRYAQVEQSLASGSRAHESLAREADDAWFGARLAFERAWVRFAQCDLFGSLATPQRDSQRAIAIECACQMLASRVFERQPQSRRIAIVLALYRTLMSVPGQDLPLVADLGLRRFRQMLADPEMTEPDACAVFDALHAMYFAGVSDVRDLRRFDAIVPIFEDWLIARHGGTVRPAVAPYAGRDVAIAYFLHTAHFQRGNAVAPLICSLAQMHAAQPRRRIYLYAVQHVLDDFETQMAGRGVTVRIYPQDDRYDRIDEIAQGLRDDAIDITITEQNRALAAALFVRRAAPRQLWIDTGFPFWSLRALDWTISPAAPAISEAPPRTSPITLRQNADTLKADADADIVAKTRAVFPSGAFVLGVFVRIVKLDRAYFDFLARLLAANDRFHLVIAGPGDPAAAQAFAARPDLRGRVTFIPGNVDLSVYGPAIDAMCDTFPFIGGLACREVSAHGTPVIAKLGTPWDVLLKADRSPDLLARSEDEYIALALRLASDGDFLRAEQQTARAKALEYADPTRMVEDVESAIAAALA